MITRRRIVLALGAGALTAPFASFAQQQGKVWRIGFLAQRHVDFVDADYIYGPFTQGMRELGYVEGRNLVIEWRSAEGKSERLPELAAELVRLKLDVLVAQGTPAARAAQKASTGLSLMSAELGPKLMEMLRGMVPKVTRVVVLVNPSNTLSAAALKNIQVAGQKVGIKIQSVEASTPREIESGFALMASHKTEALIVPQESLFLQQRNQIAELAAKHRLPTIGAYGGYAGAGGLMSHGPDIRELIRRAATYVDKILKGANPGDLPVEQPTTFELFINLKTAKAVGIKVPQSLLLQATKVIE